MKRLFSFFLSIYSWCGRQLSWPHTKFHENPKGLGFSLLIWYGMTPILLAVICYVGKV